MTLAHRYDLTRQQLYSTKIVLNLDHPMPSKCFVTSLLTALLLIGLSVAATPSKCLAQAAATKTTDETDDPNNPLIPEFRRCDTDKDGLLTEAEYKNRIGFGPQDL